METNVQNDGPRRRHPFRVMLGLLVVGVALVALLGGGGSDSKDGHDPVVEGPPWYEVAVRHATGDNGYKCDFTGGYEWHCTSQRDPDGVPVWELDNDGFQIGNGAGALVVDADGNPDPTTQPGQLD